MRLAKARRIQSEIAEILARDWDPIGIGEQAKENGEYDSYVGGVYRLLISGASSRKVAEHLVKLETDGMGLSRREVEALVPVAEKLSRLLVGLSERTAAGEQ